ncbi:unnamed protein product, partial [Mesorhabditis spiculigera]
MCTPENDTLLNLDDPTVQLVLSGLVSFNSVYTVFHRFASLFICVAGVLANVVHILVLSRPRLRRCAVNAVLTAVALCDVVTMTSYTVYLFRFRIFQGEVGYSYGWIVFLKAHVSVKMFFIVSAVISTLTIPTFYLHQIYQVDNSEGNLTLADALVPPHYSMTFSSSCGFYRFNLWMMAIIMKTVPCILLLWFTIALVLKLRATDEKRHHLYSKSFRKHIKKTTVPDRMYTHEINKYIYENVAELLDMLSLVNCSMDFILYCCMSSRYRQTFGHMLIRAESWLRNRWYRNRDEFGMPGRPKKELRIELTDDPSFSRIHCVDSGAPEPADV